MLTLNHRLFSLPHFAREQVHKKLSGSMSRRAELKCPKGYPTLHNAMLSINWGGSWLGTSNCCSGTAGGEHLYGASLSFLVLYSSLSPLLLVFTSISSIIFYFVSIIKLFLTHKVYFFSPSLSSTRCEGNKQVAVRYLIAI